jgi:hypothetical protein
MLTNNNQVSAQLHTLNNYCRMNLDLEIIFTQNVILLIVFVTIIFLRHVSLTRMRIEYKVARNMHKLFINNLSLTDKKNSRKLIGNC